MSFKVTGKDSHSGRDLISAICTAGISLIAGQSSPTYTVEDEHGNEYKVTAKNSEELGNKIADGDFDD